MKLDIFGALLCLLLSWSCCVESEDATELATEFGTESATDATPDAVTEAAEDAKRLKEKEDSELEEDAPLNTTHQSSLPRSQNKENLGKGEDAEELDAWEPPAFLLKNYPFYLTGFDEENRPIWVAEWGKFDLEKVVKGGPELTSLFDKYVRKTVRTIHKSYGLRSTADHPVTQSTFIVDFDQFKLEQLADVRTLVYGLKLAREHKELLESGTALAFLINVNYVAEVVVNLGRRVLPRVFENVEVHGTNRAKWLPQILRRFPQDQLPPWYGGPKHHKPIMVCG